MLSLFETSNCRSRGHPEFIFKVDTSRVPLVDVQWLIKVIENRVAAGESFKDDETLQIGCGLLKVRSGSDEKLHLFEPDFVTIPIEWQDTVTQTLLDLRIQKDVCESYFDMQQALFPSLRESAIICTRLAGSGDIVMERLQAEPPDSGWFIGCGGEDHDHNDSHELDRVSVYEALTKNSRARMFLALPFGTLLGANDSSIRLYRSDGLVTPKRGSYAHRLLAR